MTRRQRRRTAWAATLIGSACLTAGPGLSQANAGTGCASLTVPAATTVVIARTTTLCLLDIGSGATVSAPDGDSVSLTVNGVETGSALTRTSGAVTAIQPGRYVGRIVLAVTAQNAVAWQGLTFPFRQALYVDSSGPRADRSVSSAVTGGPVTSGVASHVRIRSTGEAFNGVYVAGGSYRLDDPRILLTGNGRSDFVGYGAAVTATGPTTRLVVDGARIDTTGAVRTGVVAEGGSNVLVKYSRIATHDGTLPADYLPTVDLATMQAAPWMLGIVGNVRATNLLGDGTKATYLDSSISSTGWGVLSVDTGSNTHLTAINSRVTTTGNEGYGSYAIGNATEEFLGTALSVQSYAAINRGGSIHYGDSSRSAVSALDAGLDLGLTDADLADLEPRATTIDSARWGVMFHGPGSVAVDGRTRFVTQRAAFLDKGQAVTVTVDGSQGAQVRSRGGILFQVMEDDDPGPVFVNGALVNQGVYVEPTTAPVKVGTFDVTTAHSDDAVATFKKIELVGDLFNGIRGNNPPGPFGPGLAGKNLVLTFDGSRITGALSATTTKHNQGTITSADYQQIGVVTNTPGAVVNNGVIVDLTGASTWTVTKQSYLSRLTVSADSTVRAPRGRTLSMTVDGAPTTPVPGHTYTGAIVVSVS